MLPYDLAGRKMYTASTVSSFFVIPGSVVCGVAADDSITVCSFIAIRALYCIGAAKLRGRGRNRTQITIERGRKKSILVIRL